MAIPDTKVLKLKDLHPAPYNPRKDLKRGDPEYDKLANSMEAFGYLEPIVWNKRSGNVVGGHQRLKVLLEAGETEALCVVVDYDETTEKAANVALNKIKGDWDFPKLADLLQELDTGAIDIELAGFDAGELAQIAGWTPGDDWGEAFGKLGEGDKAPFQQMTFTLHDSQAERVSEAIKRAKTGTDFAGSLNGNSNGNALAAICEAGAEMYRGKRARSIENDAPGIQPGSGRCDSDPCAPNSAAQVA